MKKVLFLGGLGNQMFQYAFTLSLRDKGVNALVDTTLYNYISMHNGYELGRVFGLDEDIKGGVFSHFIIRALIKYGIPPFICIDKNIFNDELFKARCLYYYGYWQNADYFKNIAHLVRDAFQFKGIDLKNQSLANEIIGRDSVSLHIRRGDYVGLAKYEGICDNNYYKSAINYINAHCKSPFFYVFTNDEEWTAKYICDININYKIISINKGKDSYKDMYLMSKCKHNIIANSSFSWWGAWLNEYSEKIIICPKRWVNDNDKIMPQLSEWIKF